MGTFSTLSIGIGGLVGGGIFAVTALIVEVTKGAAPIAFLIAGIVALLTSYSYLRLTLRFPGEGDTVEFLNRAFGPGIVSGAANILLANDTGGRAWIPAVAALSGAVALIVLCLEVDENPATRNHPGFSWA